MVVEARRMVVKLGGAVLPKKNPPFMFPSDKPWPIDVRRQVNPDGQARGGSRLVCVTSAASYIGLAVVHGLVGRGYFVRALIESQEDLERLREVESENVDCVAANMMDLESMSAAFDGCAAVFHTSSFIDPGGISGYTKHMAEMEAMVTKNVVEACARTTSVRKCILTSSLLACIWQRDVPLDPDNVIDESCWSDETVCRERKLWLALGKTMMERSAWRLARGRDIKLISICPGLVTGYGFCNQRPSTSIAYLKGVNDMFAKGTLATVDIDKVAEAHVLVYEASNSSGRYICFDDVVEEREDVLKIERLLGLPAQIFSGSGGEGGGERVKLSNGKLSRLMSRTFRCSFDSYNWITC